MSLIDIFSISSFSPPSSIVLNTLVNWMIFVKGLVIFFWNLEGEFFGLLVTDANDYHTDHHDENNC